MNDIILTREIDGPLGRFTISAPVEFGDPAAGEDLAGRALRRAQTVLLAYEKIDWWGCPGCGRVTHGPHHEGCRFLEGS